MPLPPTQPPPPTHTHTHTHPPILYHSPKGDQLAFLQQNMPYLEKWADKVAAQPKTTPNRTDTLAGRRRRRELWSIVPTTIEFLLNMLDMKRFGYSKTFNDEIQKTTVSSKYGRLLKEWPGYNTECFGDYDQVTNRLAKVPERLNSGEIVRDNSLGLLKLNGLLWDDMDDGSILLASRPEPHKFYRAYLDHTVGADRPVDHVDDTWMYTFAKGFIAGLETQSRQTMHVQNDVKIYTQKVLHKAHLGIDITTEQAQKVRKSNRTFHISV